ncbi:hypothetical protein ACLOJK_025366 [Asimina triloba]
MVAEGHGGYTRTLDGKVALITGGASGIGRATAAEFIRHGAKVILADVQHQLGEQTAAELGPDAAFVPCDVTREPDIASAVDYAVSTHGRLDIMYNNAGISGTVSAGIAELEVEEFDRVMSINLRGVVVGMKHAARVMIPRRRGCILCTASVTGILGGLAHHAYSISKFAVAGTVRSVASELCRHGIRVNCISPPGLATPLALAGLLELYPGIAEEVAAKIVEGAGELKGAKCEVEDIAKAALYLASEEGKYVSGHNLVVDGGFTTYKSFPFPSPEEVMKIMK